MFNIKKKNNEVNEEPMKANNKYKNTKDNVFNKLSNKTSDMDLTMQELSNRLDEAEKKIIDIAETTRLMVVDVAKIKSRMGL